ncbi:PQQ-binding-like beta-propeller repeat protein [Streptomyces sp. NPDC005574]|uniref:outer membrane protein assembly factor BamB family protein n=1 Tax=Streptomyces sp. NPDC005574 TaxID=3156891 RepID=UPI0033B267F4
MMSLGNGDPPHLGPFTMLAVLGAGGMATVYLASTGEPGTEEPMLAVVKVLRRDLWSDEYVIRLFRREIEALREMGAEGTLHLIDCDPDGRPPWFATEYVQGMDLRELVAQHGALATRRVLHLAAELAPILIRLQARRIVHRDLKPANILVLSAADGSLRLIDFGVARKLDRTRTHPTMKVGTDAFMAPEQIYGGADHPSDIFALGLTLAYAATGTEMDRHDLNEAIAGRAPRFPAGAFDRLPASLQDLVVACTRPEPADRITAQQLLARLAEHGVQPRARRTRSETWLTDTARTQVLKHAEHTRSFVLAQEKRARTRPRDPGSTDAPHVRWTHRLGGRAYFTSPVDATVGIAFCSLDGTVELLDAVGGGVLWRRDLPARIEHTPAADRRTIYVTCSDRTLLALDTADGSTRWRYSAGDSCLFTPAVRGDRVLVGARDGAVHCLCARTGQAEWVSSRGNGPIVDRPTVTADRVYISGWQGTVQALSLHDGSGVLQLPYVQDVVGAPAEHAQTLYLAGRTGTLCANDTRTGQERWRWAGRATAVTGPVIGHGTLFAGTVGGTLWARDLDTGARRWRFTAGSRLRCVPVYDNGTVYVGSDEALTAVAAHNGEVRWTHPVEAALQAPPLITRGAAYVGTINCTVQALSLPGPAGP